MGSWGDGGAAGLWLRPGDQRRVFHSTAMRERFDRSFLGRGTNLCIAWRAGCGYCGAGRQSSFEYFTKSRERGCLGHLPVNGLDARFLHAGALAKRELNAVAAGHQRFLTTKAPSRFG